MSDDADEAWLSVAEAAAMLGVSLKTVQRRARRGKLRYKDTGHGFLIAAAALTGRQVEQLPPPTPATHGATDPTDVATPEAAPLVLPEVIPAGELLALLQREQDRSVYLSNQLGIESTRREAAESRAAAAEAERDELRRRLADLESASIATGDATGVATRRDSDATVTQPAPAHKKRPLPYLLRRLFGDR